MFLTKWQLSDFIIFNDRTGSGSIVACQEIPQILTLLHARLPMAQLAAGHFEPRDRPEGEVDSLPGPRTSGFLG